MLNEQQINSILILSFDEVTSIANDLASVLSGVSPDVTDLERYTDASDLTKFILSDINEKGIRIPIVIDDSLLPVQHVSSSTNTRKSITYDEDNPVLSNGSNSVSVQLRIKSSLTSLSTASDIFYAIADQIFPRFTTSPRASFFGATICIFNAYITGINRQTVNGSDLEILNLTFERAPNEVESDTQEDIAPENPEPLATPIQQDTATGTITTTATEITDFQPTGKTNAGDRLFYWYNLGDLETIFDRDLPQFTGLEVVNRLEYIIHKSDLDSIVVTDGVIETVRRLFLTVEYNGVYIPLGLNDFYPYYKAKNESVGYATYALDGDLYLGIES